MNGPRRNEECSQIKIGLINDNKCKPIKSMKDCILKAECSKCNINLFPLCIGPFYTLELADKETYFAICSECKESLSKEWWIRIDNKTKIEQITGFTLRNEEFNVYDE